MDKMSFHLVTGSKAENPYGTIVGKKAFFNAVSDLDNLKFEDDSELSTIADRAFYHCGIGSFTVPKSCMAIGRSSFAHCQNLKEFVFELGKRMESMGDNE